MNILISGKLSADHADTAHAAINRLREIVVAADVCSIGTALDSLVFFPVILSDWLGVQKKSHRSYSRKENAEFVNQEIPADDWATSDDLRRNALMMEALEKAIISTRPSRLSDNAKQAIMARLRRAAG